MAVDSWMPHQFRNLSSRLVTQNGVISGWAAENAARPAPEPGPGAGTEREISFVAATLEALDHEMAANPGIFVLGEGIGQRVSGVAPPRDARRSASDAVGAIDRVSSVSR